MLVALGMASQFAFSQPWTEAYRSPTATGDCAGLSANLKNEFTVQPVISDTLFSEVAPYRIVKMAFYLQPGARHTDLYIAEKGAHDRMARVLYYNGANSSLKVIGTLQNAVYGSNGSAEHGLLGIALNSKSFSQDHFLYLMYSVSVLKAGATKAGLRISRVRLDPATHEIDFKSETEMLFIPVGPYVHYFSGSGMHFDFDGNLYVSVGSNEALAIGPANTADLRGSILRIKPDTTSPKGYSLPAGNFGEYWAQQFENQGRPGLAAKYRDTAQVKKEIYIKGVRNVYSFSVDPTRPGRVEWSSCGPDVQRGETHSLTTKPAFGGWPFWLHADGFLVRQSSRDPYGLETGDPKTTEWSAFNPVTMSPNAPVNQWPGIQGVDSLPPFHLPFFSYSSPSCAMGGPIIRYLGSVANPGKMPPHLDNTVMVADFQVSRGTHSVWAVKVNAATDSVADKPTQVFTMERSGRPNLFNPVDFQQGPDGALYLIDWGGDTYTYSPPKANTGIVRISYTGSCHDSGITTTLAGTQGVNSFQAPWFRLRSGHLVITDAGNPLLQKSRHTVKILDLQGKVLHVFSGTGSREYPLPTLPAGQLYILRAETSLGIAQRTFGAL